MSCLYTLEINPLLIVCLQIFSPILCVFVMASFAVQKLLSLIWSHLFSLFLFSLLSEVDNFFMLNQPCFSRINPAWSLCIIFFICCWTQFARIWSYYFVLIFNRYKGKEEVLFIY